MESQLKGGIGWAVIRVRPRHSPGKKLFCRTGGRVLSLQRKEVLTSGGRLFLAE